MKLKRTIYVLVMLLSLSSCAQIDDNAVETIKQFYTIRLNQFENDASVEEIDKLIKKYCSKKFIEKIYEVDWGQEFVICAQDYGDEWIKTMKIIKDKNLKEFYIVSFYDENVTPKKHIIKVKMVCENSQYKIDKVICVDY